MSIQRTPAGNPRACAVCGAELVFTRVSRADHDADVDGDYDGSVTDWVERRVISGIHCPVCELLYRVVDAMDSHQR